ncbi:HAD family hydrolase [Corynebacterium striatum]|uniref:HAD family hydrolase n=1 Tax=Corynebacterium striatum TaxID=43770 RepID=UPI002551B044|nr:HAD family hydrolase [Corynebacterium striatum]MDK8806868.1 HAD family hydrolase [Corynebacterium striatum]MDK8825920.1 HAD family hydrolase [Corynebacterium striatum]
MDTLVPQLIALDMDGTLLDPQGQLPPDFAELTELARSQGATLIPASGRQLATLQLMFPEFSTFIAENGAVVMRDGDIIATFPLPVEVVERVLDASATLPAEHTLVLCTPAGAFIERDIPDHAVAEISKYYKAVTWVDDLTAVQHDNIIKIAAYCQDGSEANLAPTINDVVQDHNVAISGKVWLDVMANGVDKGAALTAMAELSSIPLAETAAFGDFLNDYELLRTAGLAVAMDNAHPQLKEIADIIAPSNADNGVATVLRGLFAGVPTSDLSIS